MRLLRALILAFAIIASALGQPTILRVNVPSAAEHTPLSISVDLTQNAEIQRLTFWYRGFGASEFKELEMLLAGRTATVTVPAEAVLPPYVEYYVQLTKTNGQDETYPAEGPVANPLKIQVKQADPKDKEVRILSPEPGETVPAEDLVIAVSLYYASPAVDAKRTRVYLDGADVSSGAILTDDVILYSPRNFGRPLNLGSHFLKIELRDTTGLLYHSVEQTFNLSTAAAIEEEKARLKLVGNGQLEVRNEALAIGTTTYVRGDSRVDGNYRSAGFGASVHLDNQDKPERQPQNRFLLYGQTSFLRLQLGDAFPKFPSYVVSGKRVRGITGSLALGFFNLDVTYGQSDRNIEGIRAARDTVYLDSSSVSARPRNSIRTGDYFTYNIFNPGTFTRTMLAVRPSFGGGENFQLGFTYMKAADDTTSIQLGIGPKENLVLGSDLLVAFDDQRVKLEAQASVAVNNTDITGGSFTQADYDSLKVRNPSSGEDLERLGKIADKFITINQNLFPTNPVGTGLPGVAAEAILSLNYFNNYLRGTVFHRGAGYRSLGNEFLQTDLAGFQVSDNIRLWENRIFGGLSYERKQDNTASTKEITTTYSNLNTSLTVLPGIGLPTVQVGFGQYSRSGPVDLTTRLALINRPDSASVQFSADETTNRYFVGTSYDFPGRIRHSASVSMSLADRRDNTFRKRNQTNLYFQGGVTSGFGGGLQTLVSIVYSGNRTEGQTFRVDPAFLNQDSVLVVTEFNYAIVNLGIQYRLLGDNLRLAANISPAFGAFYRQDYTASVEYTYAERHNFLFQADYIQNSGSDDDAIVSLIYRFNF